MNWGIRAAIFAAGLAAFAAGPAGAGPLPPALTSFGAARPMDLLPPPGLLAAADAPLPILSNSYAASTVLSPLVSLDTGFNLDVAQRFTATDASASPFATAVTAPYLGLADGGRYAGLTLLAGKGLQLRGGAAIRSDRLDRFSFGPVPPAGLPLTQPGESRSLLAGIAYDISGWASLGLTAISNVRSGIPALAHSGLGIADRAQTNAVGVSANLKLGGNWISSISYDQGFSQLDLRSDRIESQEHSYSIAIAKRDVFNGNDALGLAFSRPAPGMLGSFSTLTASGDLPPMIIANGSRGTGQETDIQLGYVTSFLGGSLALQTNAAYQMNVQGQSGANAVSLLSRAKIKF